MKFILSICITGLVLCCYSQNQQVRTLDNRGTGWMNDLIISEYNGQPFKSYYKDVQGSPFFFDDWKFANIALSRGKKFEKIKTRIDLCSQEAHFITTNNVEIVTPRGLVTEIIMFDTLPGRADTFKFRTGFPPIENQNETNFFEVLSDGPVQLLKSTRKKIVEHKDDISGQVEKVFDAYEDYYVFHAGQIRKLKREKASVIEVLSDQKEKIEEFIKLNKTNFKKNESLIKLFDFYNSFK